MTDNGGFQVVGDGPNAYERHAAVFMNPLIEALLERVEPQLGQAVLDVACGTGLAARAAARRVGRDGRVVAVDINEEMLAVARDRAPSHPPLIELHEASAQELPFEDGEFDITLSQQGIQFFPDLEAAVVELARVTRADGTVAVTSWTAIEDSPFFHAQLTAMSEVLGDEPMAGCASAFAVPGERISEAFVAAGLRDVTSEIIAPEVSLPAMTKYAAAQVAATPWGAAFAAAPSDQQRRIVLRMADLLLEDTIDGSPLVPFSSWMVTGTR